MAISKNPVTSTVLTVVLFLTVIAGITWYVQYMPSKGITSTQVIPPPDGTVQEVLRFVRTGNQRGPLHAVWEMDKDGNDALYAKESEKGDKGEYSFLFKNMLDGPAEMEMVHADCDCTHADICVLPSEQWQKIEAALAKQPSAKPDFETTPLWQACQKSQHTGIKIPAGGHGILRISWDGRKEPGNLLKLKLNFWCQPEGDISNRQVMDVWVPVKVVFPLLHEPGKGSVGALGPGEEGSTVFHIWSATRTRKELDVAFGLQEKEKDALFDVTYKLMTDEQSKDLEDRLLKETKGMIDTRVRVGYVVTATVRAEAGGKQMDQGPFQRALPITLDAAPVTFPTPMIVGHIRGPLDVGGEADQARVHFKLFPANRTKSVAIPIYGDPQFTLEVDHSDPPFLQVDLKRNVKESTPQRGRWDLTVTIPAQAWSGVLPEQSRVVLKIAGKTPRRVRIPVVGTATQ